VRGPRADKRLLLAFVVALVSVSCGEVGGAPGTADPEEIPGALTTASPAGGTTVGEAVAQVKLRSVDDSGIEGTAVFREVGDLGVQVDLEVSGLPKAGANYYAQVHKGECADARTGGDDGEQAHRNEDHGHEHGGTGPAIALVHLDRLLSELHEEGEYAHGGHEDSSPAPDELPGNVDEPIGVTSSVDGTGNTSTLLGGLEPEHLSSGSPKYLDLHAANAKHAPTLACGNLGEAQR